LASSEVVKPRCLHFASQTGAHLPSDAERVTETLLNLVVAWRRVDDFGVFFDLVLMV
jgi:hypothetical protein